MSHVAFGDRLAEFDPLFLQLGEDLVEIGPFKPNTGRSLADFMRAKQRRHSFRHPRQNGSLLFLLLDLIPIPQNFVGILHRKVPKNVGVPPDELFRDALSHTLDAPIPISLADLGVHERLEEQVSEFLMKRLF